MIIKQDGDENWKKEIDRSRNDPSLEKICSPVFSHVWIIAKYCLNLVWIISKKLRKQPCILSIFNISYFYSNNMEKYIWIEIFIKL